MFSSKLSPVNRKKSSRPTATRWSLDTLERRLLLAADVAAPIAAPSVANAPGQKTAQSVASPTAIAFIDSAVTDAQLLTKAVLPGTDVYMIPAGADGLAFITDVLKQQHDVQSIHLIGHGKAGVIKLGLLDVDAAMLTQRVNELATWSKSLRSSADIFVYGCESGAGKNGTEFIKTLAELTGRDVAASDDHTGDHEQGADWILERSIGTIEPSIVFDPAIASTYHNTLPITVRAAGTTGEEQLKLQIDGVTVQTWNNIDGNADAAIYQSYTYNTSQAIAPDRVRVVFTNDLYVPGVKDRNVRIDNININGTTYETEAPAVYSTGTWLPADGLTPGNRQNEYLHANGYFQYAAPGTNTGSVISIVAAGVTNQETLELRINDQVVRTFNNVGGNAYSGIFETYTYRASSAVTPDQVKLAFTNDLYVVGGVDRNLRIDRIVIDGQTFQTEAPSVFSTGTWKPQDGLQPGFRESEYLHSNGFFQYAAATTAPGSISIQSSTIGVRENAGTAAINIIRTQGSTGVVTVDYDTFAASATAGSDFKSTRGTVRFAAGETTKTVLIPILNDAIAEPNEVFSFAIDNVTGGATLLAPRTATVTITDEDSALPNYPNFNSTTGLRLNGTTAASSGRLLVNSTAANSEGSTYFNTSVPISDQSSFQTNFRFDINPTTSLATTAGLLFVVQNSPAGVTAFNSADGSLGYRGTTNSLAVQFETRMLTSGPTENNIKVLTGGSLTSIATARTPLIEYQSNSTAYAWVDYDGSNNRLNVYVSTTATKPTTPTLSTTVDLAALVGDKAFFGFTAGSGSVGQSHQIRNWSVILDEPPVGGTGGTPVATSETVVGSLNQPISIDFSPDARNMYIAEKQGVVRVVRDGVRQTAPVIDISAVVNSSSDRGLNDIAIHPDLVNNPYLYLLYTYDPPEVFNNLNDPNAKPDGPGNRAGRLVRVTLNAATNYTSVIAGSEVILLGTTSTWANFNGFANSTTNFDEPPAGILANGTNLRDFIASDSTSHTVAQVSFGPDGALYVSIGDGASFNRVDLRASRVQDIDNLSGKLLRINPISGAGLADNPFFNGNANSNQSKVYQYGFRNPFRFTIDSRNGQAYVGDVGWTNWEEINAGGAGTNFGWPFYEGGVSGSLQTIQYRDTPEAQAFYASGIEVFAPLVSLNHSADGINAIIGGDIYLGSAYPAEYFGDVFFNDLGQGIVRNVSFNAAGNVVKTDIFATGSNNVVQIVQGPDGRLYYVDIDDGLVGRWNVV